MDPQSVMLLGGGASLPETVAALPSMPAISMNGHGYGLYPVTAMVFADKPWQLSASGVANAMLSPAVRVYAPSSRMTERIQPGDTRKLRDCPNVHAYDVMMRGADPAKFFQEHADWGDWPTLDDPGARSVLLVALRLAYDLGYRTVYLAGCDFDPPSEHFQRLTEQLERIHPVLREHGMTVWNLNHTSRLMVFPMVRPDEVLV